MKGLTLARAYYEQYGRPMLEREFPEVLHRIAVGLVGHGSECFGFDDTLSQDHDFEPGFCLWLREKDERDFGFRLFRAYRKLPQEFEGVKIVNKSLFGSESKGVHTIGEFYRFYTGRDGAPQTLDEWLQIPDAYLAEATNGEVFSDPLGEFTRIREELLYGRPEDVWLQKLSSALFHMAQSGQYNYARCLAHGERTAAAMYLTEFVRQTAWAVYLLNRQYAPYDKWLFRGLRQLPRLGDLPLEELLEQPYAGEENQRRIEAIAMAVIGELHRLGWSDGTEDYLEPHAYRIHDRIRDANLRNSPVMLALVR